MKKKQNCCLLQAIKSEIFNFVVVILFVVWRVHVQVCVCAHACMCTCGEVCVCAHACAEVRVHMCMCRGVCVCMDVFMVVPVDTKHRTAWRRESYIMLSVISLDNQIGPLSVKPTPC